MRVTQMGVLRKPLDSFPVSRRGAERPMANKIPTIDIGECTDCEACLELCPGVFHRNEETGIIEILPLQKYPKKEIEEAIAMCPCDCIGWDIETG
jgi:ferredoxin